MDLKTKAAKLIAQRSAALTQFVSVIEEMNNQRALLDTKELEAWTTVTEAGWTIKELSDLGVNKPKPAATKTNPTRPRKNVPALAPVPTNTDDQINGGEHNEYQ